MKKKLLKFLSLIIIFCVCTVSLSGCYQTGGIDQLAYIVALGIDVGESNNLKLTFQISVPGGESGSSSSSQSDTTIINSVECTSITSGINLFDSYLTKKINLSHCKVIVFSEAIAAKGISKEIYSLMNNIEVRPNCNIVVCKNNVEYFFKNSKPLLESLSARYYEVISTTSNYTAYTEDITLSDFFSSFNSRYSQAHAILGGTNVQYLENNGTLDKNKEEKDTTYKAGESSITNSTNVENIGLAIFNEDKLVGELNAIETLCHNIVSNNLKSCIITIPSPFEAESTLDLSIRPKNRTSNKVKLVNSSPYIQSKISLTAHIHTVDQNSKYLEKENIKLIEQYADSYLKEQILKYLYKTSLSLRADIDGFGKNVANQFLTWNDWTNYNWLNNYPNSFFDVTVNTNVKSSYQLQAT